VKALVHEASWYGVASLCALIADAGTLWILVQFLSLNYVVASAISFILGATVAYTLSVKLAFHHHRLRNRRTEFAVFVALGIPGLAINAGAISLAVEYFGLHYLLAKCFAALITFSCNFFARRQILFLQRRSAN
jgi:putative flippase GtrA